MKNELDQIIERSKDFFTNSKGSHDWDHTWRVYRMCMHIGDKEGADIEILKFAAFLHDIAREEEDRLKGKICHAKKGGCYFSEKNFRRI